MDSVLDVCFGDCSNKSVHKCKYECINDMKFKIIANNEMINLTVSGKNMNLYDLNNKLKVARENGFSIIHINKLTIKIYSCQRYINLHYYLKHRIPIIHGQFSK